MGTINIIAISMSIISLLIVVLAIRSTRKMRKQALQILYDATIIQLDNLKKEEELAKGIKQLTEIKNEFVKKIAEYKALKKELTEKRSN